MRDYLGFDLSGNNDCADLMIAASVDSGANGYEINIPTGTVALTKTIQNSGFSYRFRGQGVTHSIADNVPGANQRGPGTWLHFAHDDVGIQFLGQPGSSLRNLGTYRDQPVPSANGTDAWAPGAFDFDIEVLAASDVVLEDLMLYNPTRGISVHGGCGRVYMSRIKGHALQTGLQMQQCYDDCHVNQVKWFPFWSYDPRVAAYTYQNLIGYIIGRADSAVFSEIFVIEHYVAVYFVQTATDANNPEGLPGGAPYKVVIDKLASDTGCTAILVDSGVTSMDALITSMYSQGYDGECPNLPLANAAVFPGLVTVYGSNNRLALAEPWLGAARNCLVYVADGGSGTGNAVAVTAPFVGTFNLTGAGQAFTATGSSRGSVYQGRLQVGSDLASANFTSKGQIVGPGFTNNTGDF